MEGNGRYQLSFYLPQNGWGGRPFHTARETAASATETAVLTPPSTQHKPAGADGRSTSPFPVRV